MKRWWPVALLLAVCLSVGLFFFSSRKMSYIYPVRYTVSEDGRSMNLTVGVMSSMGYARTVKGKANGDSLYLTFYSTFGLNSTWGARDTFTIELPEGCRSIYFLPGSPDPYLAFTLSPVSGLWECTNPNLTEG